MAGVVEVKYIHLYIELYKEAHILHPGAWSLRRTDTQSKSSKGRNNIGTLEERKELVLLTHSLSAESRRG